MCITRSISFSSAAINLLSSKNYQQSIFAERMINIILLPYCVHYYEGDFHWKQQLNRIPIFTKRQYVSIVSYALFDLLCEIFVKSSMPSAYEHTK